MQSKKKSVKNRCFLICVNNTAVPQYSYGHVACMTIIAEGINIKKISKAILCVHEYVTLFVISFACSGQ